MTIKKTNKSLSFLLLIVFTIQTLTLLPWGFDGFNKLTQNSKAAILTHTYHNNVVSLSHSNKKPTYKLLTSKLDIFYETLFYSSKSSTRFLNKNEYIINFRKSIGKILSSYFHGTKYKD